MSSLSLQASPFVARTMSVWMLARCYDLRCTSTLKKWCKNAGHQLPKNKKKLSAEEVRMVVQAIGAPVIEIPPMRL